MPQKMEQKLPRSGSAMESRPLGENCAGQPDHISISTMFDFLNNIGFDSNEKDTQLAQPGGGFPFPGRGNRSNREAAIGAISGQ